MAAATKSQTSQGEFRIDNLVPGKYSVSADIPSDSNLRAEPVGFDVVDQDVTGLVIKVTKAGTSLSGRVVVQGSLERNEPTKFFDLNLTIRVSGGFALNQVAPGQYWAIASEGNSRRTDLRRPDQMEARRKLLREAETVKNRVELKACENVSNYKLTIKRN